TARVAASLPHWRFTDSCLALSIWTISLGRITTRTRFADSPGSAAKLSQTIALTAQRPVSASKKAMTCILPIVARTTSLGPTGPKFGPIAAPPRGVLQKERAVSAPAATNLKELESGDIVKLLSRYGRSRPVSSSHYTGSAIAYSAVLIPSHFGALK